MGFRGQFARQSEPLRAAGRNVCATEFSMARTLGEVIANARAERRNKIAADYGLKLLAEEQKRIAVEKKWRSEEAKPVLELDRNLITIAVVITALPIIAGSISS
jgi:hypothetical protein